MSTSFFVPDGGDFVATEHTRGPWHPDFQHAGPPSALLAHALERQAQDMQVVRLGVDLLRPVPIARLRIEVQERTAGRKRRLLEATLLDAASGRPVALALALMLRRESMELPELPTHDPAPPRAPEDCQAYAFSFFTGEVGYHTAMELRLESGGLGTGRTRMWMRQRIALLPDVAPSPLQRLLAMADSGNGVSMVLDPKRHGFANADLTVNMRREPRGEWLCLDAMTHCQPQGLGMAESRIWDRDGVVANGTQNLLVEPAR